MLVFVIHNGSNSNITAVVYNFGVVSAFMADCNFVFWLLLSQSAIIVLLLVLFLFPSYVVLASVVSKELVVIPRGLD